MSLVLFLQNLTYSKARTIFLEYTMSSLTIDEKMMLIQKMRNQSEHNIPSSIPFYAVRSSEAVSSDLEASLDGLRFFKYRIFVCLLIFSGFFSMHQLKLEIKGYEVTEVNTILEEDILPEKLQDSLETLGNELAEKLK